jgi:tRNA(Ile)-lysidine synthase TilS/MesJ
MPENTKMQRLEGLARKAMQSYGMLAAGDAVCVGVSGGKDSVALALALQHLTVYYELPFTVQALTLDPCFGREETDYTALTHFLEAADIPHTVLRTGIGPLIFDERREKNPCALCAKMRRGALHAGALALGCSKVALGHHADDAAETFYMNLWGGGRIGCFSPVTHLSRRRITVIRPFILAREYEVARAAAECGAPVVKSRCPVDGMTDRAHTKAFIAQRSQDDPAFVQKTLGALQRADIDGWRPAPEPRCGRDARDATDEQGSD